MCRLPRSDFEYYLLAFFLVGFLLLAFLCPSLVFAGQTCIKKTVAGYVAVPCKSAAASPAVASAKPPAVIPLLSNTARKRRLAALRK